MQKPAQTVAAKRRPFLTAQWRHLAMLNWEVDPELVLSRAPRGTEIDFWEGKTYVSVVGFLFLQTRVLGMAIPCHVNFEEVNLRFYVRRETQGEVRRGVVFIKEIVPRWAVTQVARWAYNENYVTLPMRHRLDGSLVGEQAGPISACYQWRFAGRWNQVQVRGEGAPEPLRPGSHEEFIAEHYWGYGRQRDGGTIEYRVEHPPWRVWRGLHGVFDGDAARLYGEPFGKILSREPDSAFLADGSAVTVGRPVRVS